MLEQVNFSGGTTSVATNPNSGAATNTSANAIANAIQQNAGITNLSGGVTYNVYPIPATFTWSVSSNNGGGAASTTVYGFNNNVLNAAVTTNGSGAASIVNAYGDGFTGKVYEQFARSANNGQGVMIKGMTIQATNYTTGAQVTAPFSTMNMTIITTNGYGPTVPVSIDWNEALRNTQYQSGILTIFKPWYLNSLTQIQLLLSVNTALVITLMTQSSSFNG